MKESFEDRITKRVKEVMEHYEPEYSPQAWEEFREKMTVPQFWLKRIFLRYRYWLGGLAITGALIVTVKILSPTALEKESFTITENSELARSPETEKKKVAVYSERTVPKIHNNLKTVTILNNEIIYPADLSDPLNDSLPAAYGKNFQIEYPTYVMSDNIEKRSIGSDLLKVKELSYPIQNTQLIPIKLQPGKIYVFKSPSYDKTGKFKLQLPAFNSLTTESKAYDRFVGPNRLALFYSSEVHHSDILKTIGISHGLGISLEGPINSSVLISVGLSFQAMNYKKTISSIKVPVRNMHQPTDTIIIPQYVDSLEIRSGSYKFLELPVSISFKFIESEKSQVWIGTGVSLIAFLGQNYTYETIVGGVSTSSSASVKPWENIYPLASLNLSLLYRYKFSDRLFLHSSIQYKQNLTEMGYNSMKLNRLNLQIGLIYRFGREN